MLGGIGDVVGMMEAGDRVAVDADNGQVFVRPARRSRGNFLQSMAARDERRAGSPPCATCPRRRATAWRST